MTTCLVRSGALVELRQQADGALSAQVTTANIECRSVTEAHSEHYEELLCNLVAWSKGKVHRHVAVCAKRWREGNPISNFSLFERGSGLFIGYAITPTIDHLGSIIGCILHKKYKGKGYEKEVHSALVEQYLPTIARMKSIASKTLLASKL